MSGHLQHIKMIIHTAQRSTPFRFGTPHGGHFSFPSSEQSSDTVATTDAGHGGMLVTECCWWMLRSPHTHHHHTLLFSAQKKIPKSLPSGQLSWMNCFDPWLMTTSRSTTRVNTLSCCTTFSGPGKSTRPRWREGLQTATAERWNSSTSWIVIPMPTVVWCYLLNTVKRRGLVYDQCFWRGEGLTTHRVKVLFMYLCCLIYVV